MRLKLLSIAGLLALVVTTACERRSLATAPTGVVGTTAAEGPVTDATSGVTIGAPQPVSPAANKVFKFVEQPIVLTITNGVTTGAVPLTYTFEVATDPGFGAKAYTRDVAQGGGNQTTVTIDKLAASKVYFWRARSNSGTIVGPNSGARSFEIGAEPILQQPVLSAPGANETVTDKVTLIVNNSQRSGPVGAVFYLFQISEQPDFGSLFYQATITENRNAPVTEHQVTVELSEATYWWRVRASDPENSLTTPFSPGNPFKVSKAQNLNLRTAEIVIGPRNIADWEETAVVTDAYFDPVNEALCIFHTRLGLWPPTPFTSDGTLAEGNQWVFAFIDGKWIGGAADWYRPGQGCKNVTAASIGRDAFYQSPSSPVYSWQPVSGEIFAVMSTTPARSWPSVKSYDERTNVVYIKWP